MTDRNLTAIDPSSLTLSSYFLRLAVMCMSLTATTAHDAVADDAAIFPAAYFDDGNDKQAVIDLRTRKAAGEVLTAEEDAVLHAASRTGLIAFCNRNNVSNAFLVRIDGRDAIITSAHAVIDPKTGKPICDLSDAGYYPNMSFYDADFGITDFDRRFVDVDGATPLNLESVLGSRLGMNPTLDFLVFFLSDKNDSLTSDNLPDGTKRGFIKLWRESIKDTGYLYMIGTDPNFRNGASTTYQKCSFKIFKENRVLFHSCDTKKGTSSSLLATLVNGELVFIGVHVGGTEDDIPLPKREYDWNTGSLNTNILEYLAEHNMAPNER